MDIYEEIYNNKLSGKSFILATIIKTAGHTPRDAGAKMIVYPDSSISGTIGGGNFEKIVIEDCQSLFTANGNHLLKSYRFEESGPDSTSMLCGGEAQVFMELYAKPDTLVIFGGGHVGRALATVASGLNFKIVVVDNRQKILKEYQSPVSTILAGKDYDADLPALDKNSFVVISTQGHKYDKAILGRVIKGDIVYVGMIGSRKKIARTFADLEKEGIEKSLLKKVHSPIGLDIGAEGPHEIAISIAAELIAEQRKLHKK
jgi:xanthine dehydrogenase accessory factor